jgi:hypothetical protein
MNFNVDLFFTKPLLRDITKANLTQLFDENVPERDESMTTRTEIAQWLTEGKEKGATHTIICCDTFDYEDYPVHVMPGQNPRKCAEGQRVMEVYSHSLDHKSQLNEHRAFHWE